MTVVKAMVKSGDAEGELTLETLNERLTETEARTFVAVKDNGNGVVHKPINEVVAIIYMVLEPFIDFHTVYIKLKKRWGLIKGVFIFLTVFTIVLFLAAGILTFTDILKIIIK